MKGELGIFLAVLRREFAAFFTTPLAYVFVLIFLAMSGVFAFRLGGFYERGQADLWVFFNYHPWLYLFLVPALSMRLWAEERGTGSIELLLTLPVRIWQTVTAKFLAAWFFCGLALAMTFPMWLTVNYLGQPDNGVIFAAYFGSWLMAGGFLAIGCCLSAFTRNPVIAFILTAVICFLFVLAGHQVFIGVFSSWAPSVIVDAIVSLGFLSHFEAASRGVIALQDVLYYLSLVAVWLAAATLAIARSQGD